MKINTGKKQGAKNLTMNIAAFMIQFIISFYISPTIVGKVGASAYGFIGLANDFVSYAAIISSVFNSVASRFIANAFYQKKYREANHYFNSLIVANLIISGVMAGAFIVVVANLQNFLSIPENLIFDVKLTFALIFVSYIIQLLSLVFTTSTFVTNRTDIQGIRNVISYLIRFALIIVFLNFVSIHIYWISLATLISTIFISVMNFNLTKKLTPELHINLKEAKKSYAFELAKSGCWMAFTSISVILLRGLDLIVANIMIGDYEMGLLSIARTIPNNITAIIGTITPLFTPVFIMLYSKNDTEGLIKNVKQTIKTMALIMYVPITGFIVFSYDFYSLWQKSLSKDEIMMITILSCITVLQAYFNSVTSTMAQLSVVTNKLKLPTLVSFGCGIVSLIIEFALILFTDLGLYSIVISTSVVMILRYVFFNSIYAAYCLEKPKFIFLPSVLKTWVVIPVLIGTMVGIRCLIQINSWLTFLLAALIVAVLGYAEMILFFGREKFIILLKRLFKRGTKT